MRYRVFIVTLFIGLLLAPEAVGASDGTEIVVGFQTAMDTWKLDRKSWSKFGGVWAYTPILETKAHDPVFGPSIEFRRGWFFGRASYLAGSTSLDVLGTTDLSYLGADAGALFRGGRFGVFLGIRQFLLEFEVNEHDVEDQSMTDVALGFLVRMDPERNGFFFDMEGAFGLSGLINALGNFETESDAPPRGDSLVELEAAVGYRPPGWPLAVRAGYNMIAWTDYLGDDLQARDGPHEGVIGGNHGLAVEIQYLMGS